MPYAVVGSASRRDRSGTLRPKIVKAVTVAGILVVGAWLALSLLNMRAAWDTCGLMFAFDERYADAREVAFDNSFLPGKTTCHFDNSISVSRRLWLGQ